MNLYDQKMVDVAVEILLLPRECQSLLLGALEICRNEAYRIKYDGFYGNNKQLNTIARISIFLKWTYFPQSALSLKFADYGKM